jgi:hypothetical protein
LVCRLWIFGDTQPATEKLTVGQSTAETAHPRAAGPAAGFTPDPDATPQTPFEAELLRNLLRFIRALDQKHNIVLQRGMWVAVRASPRGSAGPDAKLLELDSRIFNNES